MGKFFGFLFVIVLGAFTYLVLRPLPLIHFEDTDRVVGKVEKITQQNKDVVVKLEDNNEVFTIKDGFKNGISMNKIKHLEGEVATIYFLKKDFKFWDPLDPSSTIKHVAKLKTLKGVAYNEIVK